MKRILTLVFILNAVLGLNAQGTSGFWTPIGLDEVVLPEDVSREFEPLEYSAFMLEYDQLVSTLATAPKEFTDKGFSNPLLVMLPNKQGELEPYHLVYSPLLTPRVAAKYPDIRSFSGYAVNDPSKSIRCSYSPYRGFRGFIRRGDKGVEYIQPVAPGQNTYYMVYDRKAFPDALRQNNGSKIDDKYDHEFAMKKKKEAEEQASNAASDRGGNQAAPVTLKVYRFACATTGEFSQDHGGTTASVLATMVDYTNQLNAIYEADLAIRLEIVDGIENILFLDPATDPYTGTTVQDWLDQNPLAMVQNLGSADQYDIGHVFARYLGGSAAGVAFPASCCTQFKGRGCSAGTLPYGDGFFSTVGQEIGHQWAGWHSWNKCGSITEPFPDVERCEPGSGSTIMSYGGSCGSDNVQGGSDLYYQVCSIFGIRNFIENGEGSTCGMNIATGNSAPIVTIPLEDNFFIPVRTPFELDGSAVDPDGDSMTYNWDEIDLGPPSNLGSPIASAPAFRSRPPSTSTNRLFPKLSTILNNGSDKTEVLPTISRDLTFCLVARDNNPLGGGVSYDTVAFRSTDQAGPFRITYPNTSVTWEKGSFQQVTWDVANTDQAPVNCKRVNILLSTNFGFDFTYTLASNVANIGLACVQVPDVNGANCRIRVEAADNIFFDISDANFQLVDPSAPAFSFCTPELTTSVCLPDDLLLPIETASIAGFSTPITLGVNNLPAGVQAVFSQNPVMPGETANLTLVFDAGFAEGTYDIELSAEADGNTLSLPVDFTVVSNDFSAMELLLPINGASGVSQSPSLDWVGSVDANVYEVQVATSPSFEGPTLVASSSSVAVDSFKVPVFLEKGGIYYWRVRPVNECGAGDWVGPFGFATLVDNCGVFSSNDLPKNISANGTPTVTSEINILSGGTISDINITKFQGTHTFFKDLEAHLIGPGGQDVLLFGNKCPQSATFNFGFDDDAQGPFNCPPPNNQELYVPNEALAIFNQTNSTGVWTLSVKDNEISSGGILEGFSLEICSSVSLNPPFIVNNSELVLPGGTNALIQSDLLLADDADNSANELTFTLVTIPQFGHLERNWTGPMKVGDQFTQADINSGAIRFFDYGQNSADNFRFGVTDGNGGFVTGTFEIVANPLGADEALGAFNFSIAPNPASEYIQVSFSDRLETDVNLYLFDASGRQLRQWRVEKGNPGMRLNVADLPRGVYALAAQSNDMKLTQRVVIH